MNTIFKDKPVALLNLEWISYYFKENAPLKHISWVQEHNRESLREGMKSDPVLYHFLVTKKPWKFIALDDVISLTYWDIASRSVLYSSILENLYLEKLESLKSNFTEHFFNQIGIKTLTKKLIKKILVKIFPQNTLRGNLIRRLKRQ